MRYRLFILTLFLMSISAVCYAADNSLAWDSVLQDYAGTVNNGNLNTQNAFITDTLPRIVGTAMIAAAGYMYACGEMSAVQTTMMRILLGAGFAMNLGAFLNDSFFDTAQHAFAGNTPPQPDPNSADFIGAFMGYYIWLCQRGADALYPYAVTILISLTAIDMAMHLMFKLQDDILKYALMSALKVGFYIWLIANWVSGIGIAHAIYTSFERIGYIAGFAKEQGLKPDSIWANALNIIAKSIDQISNVSGFFATAFAVIFVLGTIVCIAIISLQLFLSRVEFWTIAVLILPLISLGTFKHFRFLFEKSIGAVFNAGIKVAVITFILTVTNPLLTTMVTNFEASTKDGLNITSFMTVIFGAFVLAMLVLKVPNLVQGLINGTPNLSNGDMYAPMQAARSAAQTAGKVYSGGMSQAAKMTIASQMKGGSAAQGLPGMVGTARQAISAMQQGNSEEALHTVGRYVNGKFQTAKNRGQMMYDEHFPGKYHRMLAEQRRERGQLADSRAINKAYVGAKNGDEPSQGIIRDHIQSMDTNETYQEKRR